MKDLTEMLWIALSFAGGLAARLGILVLLSIAAASLVALGVLAVRGVRSLRRRALGVRRVGGLWWHPAVLFSPAHTWLRRTGPDTLRLGVDDLAQRICVGADAVTLPAPGTRLRAGGPALAIRSGGRTVAIASPVNGTVVKVNRAVLRNPSLLKREPYHRGWLLTVAVEAVPSGRLRKGEASREWLRSEEARLNRFLERELGVAAADGGEFIFPAPSLLSDAQWSALTRSFLATPT